jgi:hypothetical protein
MIETIHEKSLGMGIDGKFRGEVIDAKTVDFKRVWKL